MRLNRRDTDKRLHTKLSWTHTAKGEFVAYGEKDDYPELMERLIKGSPTGKSAAGMLATFLAGAGFEADINNVEVGRDEKGKPITVVDILAHAAQSVAYYQGYYLRALYNKQTFELDNVAPLAFKLMRFSKPDETGQSAFVLLKREKIARLGQYTRKPSDWVKYGVYSEHLNVLVSQLEAGASGQCYFEFFDKEYFYPLSTFDSVYLDLDTEAQIGIYRNNELRNGFRPKLFIGFEDAGSDELNREQDESIIEMMGPDGNNVMTYTSTVGSDGKLREAMVVHQTKDEQKNDFLVQWEPAVQLRILQAAKNIPQLLVNFEKGGKLGDVSGVAFREAVNIYNAVTRAERTKLGQSLGKLLGKMPQFAGVTNWTIKELEL